MEDWRAGHTLFDSFQIRGRWWLPDHGEKVLGVLRHTRDSIELDLLGTLYPHPDDRTMSDIQPKAIYGETQRGERLTLMNCDESGSSGGSGFYSTAYRAKHLFIGDHLPVEGAYNARSLSVRYTYLQAWARPEYSKHTSKNDEYRSLSELTVRMEPAPLVVIDVPSLQAVLAIVGGYDYSGNELYETVVHIEYGARIRITPYEPQPLDWFDKASFDCQNLLTLFVGVPVIPLTHVYEREGAVDPDGFESPSVSVYMESQTRRQHTATPPAEPMFLSLRDVASDLPGMVENWFAKAARLRPVLDLYFGSQYNDRMYATFHFLALIQAIETYLRRQRGGTYLTVDDYEPFRAEMASKIPTNIAKDHRDALTTRIRYGYQYSLRKRITLGLDELPYELRKYVSANPRFIKALVDTRNYLTHYEPDKDGLVLEDAYDLTVAIEHMRVWIKMLLLQEIGMSDERIAKAIEDSGDDYRLLHGWIAGWT